MFSINLNFLGNCNDNNTDDTITSNGTLTSNITIFGDSWQTGNSSECSTNPTSNCTGTSEECCSIDIDFSPCDIIKSDVFAVSERVWLYSNTFLIILDLELPCCYWPRTILSILCVRCLCWQRNLSVYSFLCWTMSRCRLLFLLAWIYLLQ